MNNQTDGSRTSVNPTAEIHGILSSEIDDLTSKYMFSVPISPGNRFETPYSGIQDLATPSQFMRNQTDEIISSTREFLEMLKKASATRNIEIDEEDKERINPDLIPSSLSSAHRFTTEHSNLKLSKRK